MDTESRMEEDITRVIVYLDDKKEPILTHRPPVRFEFDTTTLDDGNHVLRIEAFDSTGRKGIRAIPFVVRNGPGIGVDGLQANDVTEGRIPILINSYGGANEMYWEPARAETPAPIPTWAWVLLLVIVAWAAFYVARLWNPPQQYASTPTYGSPLAMVKKTSEDEGKSVDALGANLYRTSCASCHQFNGQGLPGAFPALAGDPVVNSKDPSGHIRIVLFGLHGKKIKGTAYTAEMPAWAEQLSNKEIAAIINHERTSWGNNAPTVTQQDVARIRKERK